MEIQTDIHNGPVTFSFNVDTIVIYHRKTLRAAGPIEEGQITLYREDVDRFIESIRLMDTVLTRREIIH